MAKLLQWAQVQTLWTKIKNTFVAKDANGKADVEDLHVGNDIEVEGSVTTKSGDIVSNGAVEVKSGNAIYLYSDDNSKKAEMCCNEDGKLVLGGNEIATVNDVTTAVANAGHLKREKVATLPGVATAQDNVIYIVPAGDGSGDDVFDEYMKIDGKLEKIGSSRVDLTGYSTTEQMNSAINTAVSNSYTLITDAEINGLS